MCNENAFEIYIVIVTIESNIIIMYINYVFVTAKHLQGWLNKITIVYKLFTNYLQIVYKWFTNYLQIVNK